MKTITNYTELGGEVEKLYCDVMGRVNSIESNRVEWMRLLGEIEALRDSIVCEYEREQRERKAVQKAPDIKTC